MSPALADIVRATRAKKAGSGFLGFCPAHRDDHPSLTISEGDRVPVVMSCKAGCTFAAIEAALGFEKGGLTRENTPRMSEQTSAHRPDQVIAAYTYRNLDGSIFARKERLTNDVGGKSFRWARPHGEGWISGTAGTIPLYRLPELVGASKEEIAVVVEGERDVDRLASLGFVVTTTPNGAGAKWRAEDSQFFAGRRVCVIADDDEPGRKKATDTANGLKSVASSVGVIVLPNPNRIKGFDASDFLDADGSVSALRQMIENADRPKMPVEIVDHSKLLARLLELHTSGGDEPGVFPGWTSLGEYYRPRAGEMTIVTGAPNSGKSTFVDALAVNTACGDAPAGEECPGWRWLYFSAEQFPAHRHAAKLLQKILGKPFGVGPSARMSVAEIRAAWDLFAERFTIIDPSFGNSNLDRILEIAAAVKAQRGLDAIVLDPYNVFAATSRPRTSTEHEFVNEALTKVRTFAQTERVHAVIVAHPTKLKREDGDTEYPIPRPWDISGSAHWFNHADAILSVWRAMRDPARFGAGEVEIHIQKIRFQPECGKLGMVKLYFDCPTTRYNDRTQRATRLSN